MWSLVFGAPKRDTLGSVRAMPSEPRRDGATRFSGRVRRCSILRQSMRLSSYPEAPKQFLLKGCRLQSLRK